MRGTVVLIVPLCHMNNMAYPYFLEFGRNNIFRLTHLGVNLNHKCLKRWIILSFLMQLEHAREEGNNTLFDVSVNKFKTLRWVNYQMSSK